MPDSPGDTMYTLICGSLPNGSYLLALVNEHSHWPDIYILTSAPSTRTIINKLEFDFAIHGLQRKTISDNDLQFHSFEMKEYSCAYNIV